MAEETTFSTDFEVHKPSFELGFDFGGDKGYELALRDLKLGMESSGFYTSTITAVIHFAVAGAKIREITNDDD